MLSSILYFLVSQSGATAASSRAGRVCDVRCWRAKQTFARPMLHDIRSASSVGGLLGRASLSKLTKGMVSMTPSSDRFAFIRAAYVAESQDGPAESAELSVQTSVNGVTSCPAFSHLSLLSTSPEFPPRLSRREYLSVCAAPSNRSAIPSSSFTPRAEPIRRSI